MKKFCMLIVEAAHKQHLGEASCRSKVACGTLQPSDILSSKRLKLDEPDLRRRSHCRFALNPLTEFFDAARGDDALAAEGWM